MTQLKPTGLSNTVSMKKETLSLSKTASGNRTEINTEIRPSLSFRGHDFSDTFLGLPEKNIYLGNSFFRRFEIAISSEENIMKLPHITLQLNEIRCSSGRTKKIVHRARSTF